MPYDTTTTTAQACEPVNCRFCGTPAKTLSRYGCHYVHCRSCNSEGPGRGTLEAAVTDWNAMHAVPSPITLPSPGTIYPSSALMITIWVGDVTHNGTGQATHEMLIHAVRRCPILRSKATGKQFLLDWEHLMQLAQAAGIDEPETAAG